jgi:hypothetical protein
MTSAGAQAATADAWCLVLALWGDRYGARHVNEIAACAARHSAGLTRIVLVTDRPRDGIDPRVTQRPFPPPFDRPEFFGPGYRAKLAVFSPEVVPPGMPCVFLDLDSVVLGDLGRLAVLVRTPDDILMLPPAGLGFGMGRQLVDRIRGGRTFPVGNSSVLAFHSDANPNLAEDYARHYAAGSLPEGLRLHIDDVVISWFGRGHIRPVPTHLAVMFRREFLSRVPPFLRLHALLPWVRRRREGLVAVTLNGVAVKPEVLAALEDGATVADGRGRTGQWSHAQMGTVRDRLADSCRRLAGPAREVARDSGTDDETDATRRN